MQLTRPPRKLSVAKYLNSKSLGFSLVELMVGIAILAVLLGVALPSFKTMLLNSEIRNAAESIANGMQKARAEAVARNTNVNFVLGANASGTYTSWTVNQVNPAAVIESRRSKEGSKNVTRSVLPANATTVTFNNLGQVIDLAPLSQVDVAAVGGTKNMRVTIGVGGNARMCDLSLALGSGPRAC